MPGQPQVQAELETLLRELRPWQIDGSWNAHSSHSSSVS
jgi:hypothetical protein